MILPQLLEAWTPAGQSVRAVDPYSGREIVGVVRAHLGEGWLDVVETVDCMSYDPNCILFDGKPTMKRWRYPVDPMQPPRTVRQHQPFVLVDACTGAFVVLVSPPGG